MSNSPEIEQVIRLVLERLATAGDLMAGVGQITQPPANELVLEARVITLSAVEGQLEGKQRVRVSSRAVVTPAVSDLLRSKKVELVRGQAGSTSKSTNHRVPLLVCGSAPWFATLNKSLCPKLTKVEGCDDTQGPKLIASHLSSGGSHAIWISQKPYAASVAVASAGCCRAVMLPSLGELNDALSQANPQAVIIDSQRWTVAALGNLVRRLSRSK